MVTVAEFSVTSDEFPLGSIFIEEPNAVVELERIVPTAAVLVPYFWVQGADTKQIISRFNDHPEVRTVRLIDEIRDTALLRVEWESDVTGILQAIIDSDVTVLSAKGTSSGWTFEIRAEKFDELRAFQGKCSEYEIQINLRSTHELSSMDQHRSYELSDEQREALIHAFREGYYLSPQQTTLDELGATFGISGQALGARLRRGVHNLIENTLIDN